MKANSERGISATKIVLETIGDLTLQKILVEVGKNMFETGDMMEFRLTKCNHPEDERQLITYINQENELIDVFTLDFKAVDCEVIAIQIDDENIVICTPDDLKDITEFLESTAEYVEDATEDLLC